MAEVMSDMLNYGKQRQKASSSRSYRVKVPSSNGTSFTLGNSINIDLPSNLKNSYIDFANSYLSFKVQKTDTGGGNDGTGTTNVRLGSGSAGAYSLINRLEGIVSSQTIFSINNYNQLCDMLMDMEVNAEYKNNIGSILLGTNSSKYGGKMIKSASANLANTTNAVKPKQFCLPLIGNCLFNTEKYIPAFSAEHIRLRITLENALKALINTGSTDAVSDSDVNVFDVEMVCYIVEVDDEVQQLIEAQNGGVFSLVGDDYRHTQGSLDQNATSKNVVCGFSFGSLNRVLGAFTPTASLAPRSCSFTRSTATATKLAISINGQRLPQREIKELGNDTNMKENGGAETLAEILVADRQLSNFNAQNSLSNMISTGSNGGHLEDAFTELSSFTRSTDADCNGEDHDSIGTYMFAIDTERVRGDLSSMYAGINTIGAVVQGEFEFVSAPQACNIDLFANYTTKLTLDTTGSNVFEVQI